MYSNSYCSYKFAPKREKIGQSSHKEYSNNILKYLEFTAIINACTKKVWKLIECTSYIGKTGLGTLSLDDICQMANKNTLPLEKGQVHVVQKVT